MASQRSWRTGPPRIKTSQEASSTARGPVKATHPFSESFALARSHGSSQAGKRTVGASPERRPPPNVAVNLSGKDPKSSYGWKTPPITPNLFPSSPNPKRSTSLGSLPDADVTYLNSQWPKLPCQDNKSQQLEPESSNDSKVPHKILHRRSNSAGTFVIPQKSSPAPVVKSGRSSAPVSPGNTYSYQGPITNELKIGSSRRSLEGLNQEVSSSFENCEFSISPKYTSDDGRRPGLVDYLSRLSVGTQTPPASLSPSPGVSLSPYVGTQTTPTDIEVAMHSGEGIDYHRYPPSPKPVIGRGPPDGAEKPVKLEPVYDNPDRVYIGPDRTKAKVIKSSPGSGFSTPTNPPATPSP